MNRQSSIGYDARYGYVRRLPLDNTSLVTVYRLTFRRYV